MPSTFDTIPAVTIELSPEEITELRASKRRRGGHEQFVRQFVASGNMTWLVNGHADYKGKTAAQLDTSVKQGIKKAVEKMLREEVVLPTLDVLMKGDDLIIVNLDIHAQKVAEAAAAGAEASE